MVIMDSADVTPQNIHVLTIQTTVDLSETMAKTLVLTIDERTYFACILRVCSMVVESYRLPPDFWQYYAFMRHNDLV